MAHSRAADLATALGVLYGLSVLFGALRCYVRICISKNWGHDDSLLMAALAAFTLYVACSATGIHYGTGRHVQDIPEQDLPKALMYWWLCEIWYPLSTMLLRISISIFLLRICVRRSHKYLIYVTIGAVVIFTIFYVFLAIFQCQPTSYFWAQFAGEKGRCIDKSIFPNATYAHSAISATADFVLGLLPVWIIWELKMNVQTKISVGIVLSMGIIAGFGALIRIPYIRVLAITDDFLYATVDVAIWSTVEPALGIIAAAACVLRPLFKNFYDLRTYGRSNAGRNPSTYDRIRHGIGRRRGNAFNEVLELGQKNAGIDAAGSASIYVGHTAPTSYIARNQGAEKVSRVLNKSINSSHSSQEELAERGGIQVLKTVEISRTQKQEQGGARGAWIQTVDPFQNHDI